jgi:hypothetical protein
MIFTQTNETKKIKVSMEDEVKYYKHFDLVHAQHWQEEVVRLCVTPTPPLSHAANRMTPTLVTTVLNAHGYWASPIRPHRYDMITTQADKDDRAQALRIKRSANGVPAGGAIIQGYLLKKSHGMFKAWHKRYVHLYADRIEVRKEEHSVVKRLLPHAKITFDVVVHPNEPKLLVFVDDDKTYEFKTFYRTDEHPWIGSVHKAWEDCTGLKSKCVHSVTLRCSLDGCSLPPPCLSFGC